MIFFLFVVFSLQSNDFLLKRWSGECETGDLIYHQYVVADECFMYDGDAQIYTEDGSSVTVKRYKTLKDCQERLWSVDESIYPLNAEIEKDEECEYYTHSWNMKSFEDEHRDLGLYELSQKIYDSEYCDGNKLSVVWEIVERAKCAKYGVKDCDNEEGQSIFYAACDLPSEKIAPWEEMFLYALLIFSISTLLFVTFLCIVSVIYVAIRDKRHEEAMEELTKQEDVWKLEKAIMNVQHDDDEEEFTSETGTSDFETTEDEKLD